MSICAWVFALALSAEAQDNKPAPKLELVEENARWHFKFAGPIDVPDNTLVYVKMYYVTIDANGEEEATSFYHDSKPVEARTRTAKGAFEATLGDFPRKPYPIRFRATVADNAEPSAALATAEIAAAPASELEPILKPVQEALVRDFAEVEKLSMELQKQFTSITAGTGDAAKWDTWKGGFLNRVDALKRANDLRFEIWIVFIERNGKLRLRTLVDLLYQLVAMGSKALAAAGEEREKQLTDAKDVLDEFKRDYNDALDKLGLGQTPDAATLTPLLDEAAKLIESLDKATAADVANLTLRISAAATPRMQAPAQELATALMDGEKARAEMALATLRAALKPAVPALKP